MLELPQNECLIAWLRFYDLPSVAVSQRGRASQHRIAQHCDFVVGRHDRIFVGGECSSPYWLLGDSLSLSLSLRAVLQRRSTRWELCYRSALESVRLSTGQKVRLYRGLMLLYKECRKKKERKEKEILISPSRIAVRFERLQFVFVFYFIIFYYIFLAHLKSKDVVVVVVASRTWPFVCTFCSTSRVSICCDSGSCVMGTILLFSSSFFLSLLRKKKVVTLDGPTRRNKTKERGRRSGIYRIARKYGNPRQRYRAVSPSLFPFSVRRWWGPSISFLLSFFFARGGGGGALMLRKCTVFI